MYKIKRREIGTSRIFLGSYTYSDREKHLAEEIKNFLSKKYGRHFVRSVVKL